MMIEAVDVPEGDREVLEKFWQEFKGLHGLKASWPTIMVGLGEDYAAKLQGHWLDPSMVERYARDKLAFPIKKVWEITQDVQNGVKLQGYKKMLVSQSRQRLVPK